jgi:hypothetical protein
MNEFAISAILNVLLFVVLVVVVIRAKLRMVDEKVATFAGCLGAITNGIAYNEIDDRSKNIAAGLCLAKKGLDEEELVWRLARAGCLRMLRTEATVADIGGEHARELFLRAIAISNRNDEDAEQIWAYICGIIDGSVKFRQEPRERFGNDRLAKAQYQIEAQILTSYRVSVEAMPPKLFS